MDRADGRLLERPSISNALLRASIPQGLGVSCHRRRYGHLSEPVTSHLMKEVGCMAENTFEQSRAVTGPGGRAHIGSLRGIVRL